MIVLLCCVSQVDVAGAFSDPEKAGTDNVGQAIQVTKMAETDGLFFGLRFQKLGQRLKRGAIEWYAKRQQTGLTNVRVTRLNQRAGELACGYEFVKAWKSVIQEVHEMLGNAADSDALCAELLPTMTAISKQRTACMEYAYLKINELIRIALDSGDDKTAVANASQRFTDEAR